MSNAYEYQKKAAACILLAEETQDIANRLILMGMAQGWLLLAEQADKNSLDPTHATSQLRPPQPACTSTVAQQQQQQQQRLVEPEQDTEEK